MFDAFTALAVLLRVCWRIALLVRGAAPAEQTLLPISVQARPCTARCITSQTTSNHSFHPYGLLWRGKCR